MLRGRDDRRLCCEYCYGKRRNQRFRSILNNESSNSVYVLNEVEMAYKHIIEKRGELTILPLKSEDKDMSETTEYHAKKCMEQILRCMG